MPIRFGSCCDYRTGMLCGIGIYDIADLYKAEVTSPVAFDMAAQQPDDLPSATRRRVRDAMVSAHILERMVRDIHILFSDDEWIAEEITTEIVYLWDDKK